MMGSWLEIIYIFILRYSNQRLTENHSTIFFIRYSLMINDFRDYYFTQVTDPRQSLSTQIRTQVHVQPFYNIIIVVMVYFNLELILHVDC